VLRTKEVYLQYKLNHRTILCFLIQNRQISVFLYESHVTDSIVHTKGDGTGCSAYSLESEEDSCVLSFHTALSGDALVWVGDSREVMEGCSDGSMNNDREGVNMSDVAGEGLGGGICSAICNTSVTSY